jgi:hypothetical protein
MSRKISESVGLSVRSLLWRRYSFEAANPDAVFDSLDPSWDRLNDFKTVSHTRGPLRLAG